MDSNIIYFLGAGASYNALPLANKFAEKLIRFSNDLREIKLNSLPRGLGDDDIDPLIDDAMWLGMEGGKHSSIDTFAKKLFFKKDYTNLKRLKAVISTFLIIEQSQKNVDYRYDSFLATVLKEKNGGVELPEGLRFITWNYDAQFDKAFYGFCDNEDAVVKKITLGNIIFRLNGRCGTLQSGHIGNHFLTIMKDDHESSIRNGIDLYNSYLRDNAYADINFAWEDNTITRFTNTDLNLANTRCMVIIGYSFPYFNREIDYKLLNSFSSPNVHKKIYLQLPEEYQESILTRINPLIIDHGRNRVEIISITNTDQFYIPDEFWELQAS